MFYFLSPELVEVISCDSDLRSPDSYCSLFAGVLGICWLVGGIYLGGDDIDSLVGVGDFILFFVVEFGHFFVGSSKDGHVGLFKQFHEVAFLPFENGRYQLIKRN